MARQNDLIHFLKDLALAGGVFMIRYVYIMIPNLPISITEGFFKIILLSISSHLGEKFFQWNDCEANDNMRSLPGTCHFPSPNHFPFCSYAFARFAINSSVIPLVEKPPS